MDILIGGTALCLPDNIQCHLTEPAIAPPKFPITAISTPKSLSPRSQPKIHSLLGNACYKMDTLVGVRPCAYPAIPSATLLNPRSQLRLAMSIKSFWQLWQRLCDLPLISPNQVFSGRLYISKKATKTISPKQPINRS